MQMMRRLMQIGAFVVAVHLVFNVVSAEPVTITVWDAISLTHRDAYVAIIEEFEALHPNITVETTYVPGYWELREKFQVALFGGVPPNVVHQAHVQAYGFRHMGVFMALDDYIAADPNFDLAEWYPPFLEAVEYDGSIYGIPYNISSPMLYFSPYLLEESGLQPHAPRTWDEMVQMGRVVTRDVSGDGEPDIWAMDTVRSPEWVMEAYLGQAGGRTVNDDKTELTLNSPEGVRAWEFQQDLIHTHRISRYPGAPGADHDGGRIGWWIRSSSNMRNRLEKPVVPIDVAPLPCDVECYAPIGGGALYAVDTGTQAQRDASYKLLSFLAEPDNLARYAAASGYMVGRRSAIASDYLQAVFQDFPQFLVTYEQLDHAHPETQAPEWGLIQELWMDRPTFLDPIYKDNMPVKPVLDDLVRRGNAILREFYERYPAQ